MAGKSAILSVRIISDAKKAVAGFQETSGAVAKFSKGAKLAAGAAAGLVTTVAGMAIKGGISRYLATEDAIAKLKGLKYSAADAAKIIQDQVRPAVKGTIYSTGEAANVAAGALGSGIKQGKELTNYLKLTADAASQAQIEYGAMGGMMNKVTGAGKLTGEVVQQLNDNGLYVLPMLAKEFGKSQAEMTKMVSSGKISAEQFRDVLTKNIGGAAQEAGATTRGAFKNMITSFSILGEKVVSGIMPAVRDSFGMVKNGVESLGPAAEKLGEWLGDKVPLAVEVLKSALSGIGEYVKPFFNLASSVSPLQIIFAALQPLLPQVKDLFGQLAQMAGNLASTLGPLAADIAAQLAPVFMTLATDVLPTVISAVISIVSALAPLVSLLVSVLAPAVKAILPIVIGVVQGIISNVVGVVQGIVKVITGMVDLVTAIFRGDWSAAWDAVKQIVSGAVQAVWNLVQLWIVGRFLGGIKLAVNAAKTVFKSAMTFITGAVRVGFTAVKSIATTMMNGFKAVISGNITKAVGFFKQVPGKITSALGNVGGLLVKAGKAILDGFLRGLKGAWEGVKNFVGGIGSWIADHKGPISYDRKLLQPAGVAIMGGLMKSMKAQMPNLRKLLGQVTNEIGGLEANPRVSLDATGRRAAASKERSGNTYIIQVSGVVGDKIGLARQIKKLLEDEKKLVGA